MRRRRVYGTLLGLFAAVLILLVLLEQQPDSPDPQSAPEPVAVNEAVSESADPVKSAKDIKSAAALEPPTAGREPVAKVAIIIDDVGYHGELDQLAVAIPFPLTFSVLPGLDSSAASAVLLRSAGCEIMLHLPMEPEQYPEKNPGPGALFTFMTPDEIRQTIRDDILSVPGARGANNHMGSLFTVREDLLKVVFEELRRHDLFFIDSRTTTATVAQRVARKLGVKTGRRSIFLDNLDDPSAITTQLEQLFEVAARDRSAVGIGHYRETTLRVLTSEVPRLSRLHPGIELVYASDVVN